MFKALLLLMLVSLGATQDDIPQENEKITILDLSNKGITSLNDYDFTKYPHLQELDLSNNLIENIKEDKFMKNTELKKLNLSGNTALKLPQFSSLLISDIEEINLSNCDIEVFPPSILDGLLKLKVIDLSNNPLTSIKLITFSNLLSPEKIILPNLDDKKTITEICNELNITLEDTEKIIPCADVRNNKWEGIVKENNGPSIKDVPMVDTPISLPTEEDNSKDTKTADTTDHPEDVENNTTEILTSDTPKATDNPISATQNDSETQTVDSTTINPPDSKVTTVETPNTTNTLVEVSKTPEDGQIPTNIEPQLVTNSIVSDQNNVVADKTNGTNDVKIADSILVSNDKNKVEVDGSQQTMPKVDQTPSLVATQRDGSILPPESLKGQEVPTIGVQRSAPIQTENKQSTANTQENQNSKVQEVKISQEVVKQGNSSEGTAGASTQPSTGTNILIFLVVAVIISGMAAFGYRFYKTRTYSTTSTQEPVERELQEIVTDKKNNGTALSNVLEEEPLMLNNETSSVPIRETGATTENNENHTAVANTKPYVPITSIITTEKTVK